MASTASARAVERVVRVCVAVTTTPGPCGWPFFAKTGTRNRRTLLTRAVGR